MCRVACFLQITLAGLRQMATRCKFRGRRGIFWDELKIDGTLARNIDFEVAEFQVPEKSRRKTSIFKLQSVKIGGSLARNARFGAPTCLVSSLWFSCGLAVSMGEAAKLLLCACFQLWNLAEVSHEMLVLVLPPVSSRVSGFLVASQARHFVTFQPVLYRVESRFVWQAQYFCVLFTRWLAVFVAGATFCRSLPSFCVAGAALQTCRIACSTLTLHSTLYTPHFTLHPFHFIHSTLYTLHSRLYTLHSTLYTLHFTLYTLHSTLHTLHFTLYTVTPHSTLYTLHSTLYLDSTVHTLNSTLYTLHSTLHTPHSTHDTHHFTLYT